MNILLNICGAFYALLCVFSIVTGLMYADGHRTLNPVELSDAFMRRYADPAKLRRFTVRMGWVTFAVGIAQGIVAYALICRGSPALYWIAPGFMAFSILSVVFKLKGKRNAFPLLKYTAYPAIPVVLLLNGTRVQFFR